MPRYYFHVRDGDDMPDREGVELPSDEVAKRHAIASVSGMLQEKMPNDLWNGSPWYMTVQRDDGRHVGVLRFTASQT